MVFLWYDGCVASHFSALSSTIWIKDSSSVESKSAEFCVIGVFMSNCGQRRLEIHFGAVDHDRSRGRQKILAGSVYWKPFSQQTNNYLFGCVCWHVIHPSSKTRKLHRPTWFVYVLRCVWLPTSVPLRRQLPCPCPLYCVCQVGRHTVTNRLSVSVVCRSFTFLAVSLCCLPL